MNREYVIKKGETLWEISKKIYGTGELYHIIAKENEISNPDTIQCGQIIKIPDVEFYTEKEILEEAEKCEEYKKEIERLNNIINELEEWLKVNLENLKTENAENTYNMGLKRGMIVNGNLILKKLKELKGDKQ